MNRDRSTQGPDIIAKNHVMHIWIIINNDIIWRDVTQAYIKIETVNEHEEYKSAPDELVLKSATVLNFYRSVM